MEGKSLARKLKTDPSRIKNKQHRNEIANLQMREKKKQKKERQTKRRREAELLGDDAPPKQVPKTLDNARAYDPTYVTAEDEEVMLDQQTDNFADYFKGEREPKVFVTTGVSPSKVSKIFVKDLLLLFHNAEYFSRRRFELGKLIDFATNRNYTAIILLLEDAKKIHTLYIINLPFGPTAQFRISNIKLSSDIQYSHRPTGHKPELILNNFNTRIGHSLGRMFASLFPYSPDFRGRRVVTFHNQRDYIFVRHHRYEFDSPEKVRLQDLGPRFTLKLSKMQGGVFNISDDGEYEWFVKPKMETSKKIFTM